MSWGNAQGEIIPEAARHAHVQSFGDVSKRIKYRSLWCVFFYCTPDLYRVLDIQEALLSQRGQRVGHA